MTDGAAGTVLQEFWGPQGTKIRNHSQIGRELQRGCRRMLARFVPENGCGFQDGGCLTLATALRNWSDDRLEIRAAYRTGRYDVADHMFASLGNLCLDSDGMATEQEMTAKLDRFEHPIHHRIGSYDSSKQGGNSYFPEAVGWVAQRLAARLGAFDEERLRAGQREKANA